MKNITKHTQSIEVKNVAAAGGQTAPAGAVWPPAAGGRGLAPAAPPDPEVTVKKPRRKFTAKYKLQILEEVDDCTKQGQIGALLRREGLYSSYLATWRRQKQKGLLEAMAPQKRGRKKKKKNPLANKLACLEKENRRLKQNLKKAEIIIEVQKKISDFLSIDLDLSHNERNS